MAKIPKLNSNRLKKLNRAL